MKLKFIIDKEYDKRYVTSKKQLSDLEEQYGLIMRQMKYSQKEYQKSWDEIGQDFSDYILKGIDMVAKDANIGPE